jgi:hypothetical protein
MAGSGGGAPEPVEKETKASVLGKHRVSMLATKGGRASARRLRASQSGSVQREVFGDRSAVVGVEALRDAVGEKSGDDGAADACGRPRRNRDRM